MGPTRVLESERTEGIASKKRRLIPSVPKDPAKVKNSLRAESLPNGKTSNGTLERKIKEVKSGQ